MQLRSTSGGSARANSNERSGSPAWQTEVRSVRFIDYVRNRRWLLALLVLLAAAGLVWLLHVIAQASRMFRESGMLRQ
jgi:hypothetical protein